MKTQKITKDYQFYNEIMSITKYLDGHKGFIAGGVFKDIFKGKPCKDVDIFFENRKDFFEAVEYFQGLNFIYIYSNGNAVRFKDPENGIDIELIKRFIGGPFETISEFDFTVSMFALSKVKNEYVTTHFDSFFRHLDSNELVLNTVKHPIDTLKRVIRYSKYGFNISNYDLREIIKEITFYDGEDVEDMFYQTENTIQRRSLL